MRHGYRKGFWVFVAAATVTTTAFTFQAGEPRFFSHKRHIEEYGAECANCHEMEADPPAVKSDSCAACHDETVGKERMRVRARRVDDVVFSHGVHTNVAVCEDCHKTTVKDRQKKNRPMQPYARCVDCHKENGIAIPAFQCASCHQETGRNTRPTGHKKSWMTLHGKIADWAGDRDHGERDCTLCHTKMACKTCHMTMKPKSHTALWRIRTHGLSASMDRDRCKTCHETGVCINCHRHTAPQSHRGTWPRVHGLAGAAAPEKCRVCHSAAYGTSSACRNCHGGGR